MKLQVTVVGEVASRMRAIPRNNRSLVVTYALMRCFDSTEKKDVDFLSVVSLNEAEFTRLKEKVRQEEEKDVAHFHNTESPNPELSMDAKDIACGLVDDED